jgi:outer membrane cobalamin receptor
MKVPYFPIYFILLLINPSFIFSENTEPVLQDSLKFRRYVLEKVKVVAGRPEETIGTVSVIDNEKLSNKADLNVKEALENAGGISTTVGTKDESNLRIRGFRKNEVRVMVDGRQLNPGYFGNVDLQGLNLGEIEEIQILKGPVSTLYGNNTMGGVVNLITKIPSKEKWARIGLLAKRNNNNKIELSLSHAFEDLNFKLEASRNNSDGLIMSGDFTPTVSENGDIRNNSSKTQYDFSGKINSAIFNFHAIGLSAGVSYIGKKLIPCSVYELADYRMYKDWLRYYSTILGEFQTSYNSNLYSSVYLDGGADTYKQYNDPDYQFLNVDSDMKYWIIGMNPRLEWQLNQNNKINIGFRYDNQSSTRKDNGDYLTWTDNSLQNGNLFTQLEYKVNPKFRISGSYGVTYYMNDVRDDPSFCHEPALGLYYSLTGMSVISLACGINSALPTMRQLFSADRGNPYLEPQTAVKTEMSFTVPIIAKITSGKVSLSCYYNAVDNLIDIVSGIYENVNKVNSYGAEVSIVYRFFPWLETNADYAFLEYDSVSDYRLTESPRHSFSWSLITRLPFGFKAVYDAQYKDSRLSNDNAELNHKLPSYWNHSLFLQKSFYNNSVRFGIENMFDEYYEEEYGYPAAGRDFSFSLSTEI